MYRQMDGGIGKRKTDGQGQRNRQRNRLVGAWMDRFIHTSIHIWGNRETQLDKETDRKIGSKKEC